ncbi:hypothetical protein [Epilithonimonas sp.]|uniref:hypothetical protein n=1 Tax=Epilithonimonas sp. TaxID=2894511 RepID=UPI00289EFA62|nr:hypothetical protein [Epilithonimonas sp.]
MKKYFLTIAFALLTLVCCRGDEDNTQIIDQVLMMYVHNATGQDMLNSKIPGSYSSVALLDLLDETTADKPISGQTFPKDADTVVYMDYPAGAIRLLKDTITSDSQEKIYYSNFIIQYFKIVNSVSTLSSQDTIRIEYSWKPSLFQISKLWYNEQLKFTKVQGQRNVVRIVK